MSWRQVERLFHLSVFESMPLTTVDDQGVLETASGPLGTLEPVIPWDNPLSFAKQQLNKQQGGGLFHVDDELTVIMLYIELFNLIELFVGQTFVTEDAGNTRVLLRFS